MDRIHGLNIKIEVTPVTGDLHQFEVVSARVVGIGYRRNGECGGVVARVGIADVIAVCGRNLIPILHTPDLLFGSRIGNRLDPLVPTDVGHKLHVVVILHASRKRRFEVTAVLGARLIAEPRVFGILVGTWPTAGYPFVPSRDKHEWYILLQCIVPLLLKVVAIDDVFARIARMAVVVAAAPVFRVAVKGRSAHARFPVRVLRHGYVDDLALAGCVAVHLLRTGKRDPWPTVGLVRLVGPLGFPVGKEVFVFTTFRLGRYADDERFAVEVVPAFGVVIGGSGFIEGIVCLLYPVARLRVGVEYDPGRIFPLLADGIHRTHQDIGLLLINEGVRGVDNHEVDAGIGQQLHAAEVDPIVVRTVVAVDRFAPIIESRKFG